jgi:hypothetical protein
MKRGRVTANKDGLISFSSMLAVHSQQESDDGDTEHAHQIDLQRKTYREGEDYQIAIEWSNLEVRTGDKELLDHITLRQEMSDQFPHNTSENDTQKEYECHETYSSFCRHNQPPFTLYNESI